MREKNSQGAQYTQPRWSSEGTFRALLLLSIGSISLCAIKLFTTLGQRFVLYPWQWADDGLFVRQALHLITSGWLGPYDNLTLVKGPGYPLVVAANFLLGTPLLLTHVLVYATGAVVFVWALRPLVRAPLLLLALLALLLFDPMTFAYGSMRAVRVHVYSGITMAVVGAGLGLMLRTQANRVSALPWAILLGISLGLLWITREEGVWIIPYLLVVAVVTAIAIGSPFSSRENLKRYFVLMMVPGIIAAGIVAAVAARNYIE